SAPPHPAMATIALVTKNLTRSAFISCSSSCQEGRGQRLLFPLAGFGAAAASRSAGRQGHFRFLARSGGKNAASVRPQSRRSNERKRTKRGASRSALRRYGGGLRR